MFELSDTHRYLQEHFREFVEGSIVDEAKWTSDDVRHLLGLLNEHHYLGFNIGEQYGGADLDTLASTLFLREIARVSPSLAHVLNANNVGFGVPIAQNGTSAQKETYLTKLAVGEVIGALAFTDPDGSNLDCMNLYAREKADGFVLNGTKTMVTNAVNATHALVFAKREDMEDLTRAFSWFIVPLEGSDTIRISKPENTMGLQVCPISEISFDEHFVDSDALLGEPGEGVSILRRFIPYSRLANSALSLGIAESAFENAVRFSRKRILHGNPLIKNMHINYTLADMYSDLETIRLLTFHTAHLMDGNPDPTNGFYYPSITKYRVTETAIQICDRALQIHGGSGYIKDYKIESLYRDVRIGTIIGGSSEILLSQIGDYVLNLPYD